jgi:hypothetical protein
MTEQRTEKPQEIPICEKIIQQVKEKDEIQMSLNMKNIKEIFDRQAKLDESGDLPVLLPDFRAKIENGEFHLYAPYTVDEDKKFLIFEGKARNNEEGDLVESEKIKVEPESLRERTMEAFGGQLDTVNFTKLITEDAFQGNILVEKIFVDNDKLGMVFKNAKIEDN